jgi:uncharacterized repeat protein (TIGR03803 family)
MIRYVASAIALGLLAACTGSQTGRAMPAAPANKHAGASPRTTPVESIIYSFGTRQPDGVDPLLGLVELGGTLYGSTTKSTSSQYGTVYGVTTAAGETVLGVLTKGQGETIHGLTAVPNASGNGKTLYGVGYAGGRHGHGTVVKISRTGRVTVLYGFMGGTDGANPNTSLISINGTLYGTTAYGGRTSGCPLDTGCGTVFSITPSGSENVVYRFTSLHSAAWVPEGGLVYYNGTIYGTTLYGGTHGDGAVFSLTPSGSEQVLYSFAGGADGAYPNGGLTEVGGVLYGTTFDGGSVYDGTVFSVTTSGVEKVVHSFGRGTDGMSPDGIISFNGALYGVTVAGGSSEHGTVFRIDAAGYEKVIYSFAGGSDGGGPSGTLLGIGRTLYGVTSGGGTFSDGTVYSITL